MEITDNKIWKLGKSFLLLPVLVSLFLFSCGKKETKLEEPAVKIKTALPVKMKFREKIRSFGNAEPEDYVKICARTEGVIDEMKVAEGDLVKKGQLLFQIDKINLESQVEVQKQNLNLAITRVKEAEGYLAISKAQQNKAKIDFDRSKRLMESKVEAQDSYEKKELQHIKSKLQIDLSGAGLKLAQARVKQAQSNLAIAKKKYDDSLIKAPYNAVVTHKYLKRGEYAKMGDCILRLEDADKLEISIFLSSVYYTRIKPGVTKAVIYSENSEKIDEKPVTYRSPYIDPQSRTFEIAIDLPPGKGFVSGMLCEVELILSEKTAFGVPQDAVIPRIGGETVVFTVRDGKAAAIKVKTGLEDNGYTELIGFHNPDKTPVVVSGQSFLNDGSKVKIIEDLKKNIAGNSNTK